MREFIAVGIVILLLFLGLLYFHHKNGINEEFIKYQEEKIQIQNETIHTKNLQEHLISITANNSDIHARNEWMQLLIAERENSNN